MSSSYSSDDDIGGSSDRNVSSGVVGCFFHRWLS